MKISHATETDKARKMIESKACDVLVVHPTGKDSIKTLDTIITPLLARLARENDIAIGLDIKTVSTHSPADKAKVIARLRQVIAYCRKTKTRLATNLSSRKSKGLLISLGASTGQASQALTQAF